MKKTLSILFILISFLVNAQDKKISQLTALSSVYGSEKIPVAYSGSNYYMTPSQLQTWLNIVGYVPLAGTLNGRPVTSSIEYQGSSSVPVIIDTLPSDLLLGSGNLKNLSIATKKATLALSGNITHPAVAVRCSTSTNNTVLSLKDNFYSLINANSSNSLTHGFSSAVGGFGIFATDATGVYLTKLNTTPTSIFLQSTNPVFKGANYDPSTCDLINLNRDSTSILHQGAIQRLIAAATPTLSTLTNGYGISGSTYNGSVARTWVADSTVLASKLYVTAKLLGKQNALNGTGFVKATGTVVTYDNSTYLTTGTASSTYAPINNPTFTGNVTLAQDATSNLQAVTLQQLNNAIAGTDYKLACKYVTVSTLPPYVYNNGSSGVGATITGVSFGAITFDGVTPTVGDRVLIVLETSTNTPYNGSYVVTTVGNVAALYVLTRTTDFNQASEINAGDAFFITAGNTKASSTYVYNGITAPTTGTTNLTFTQTQGAGVYSAGYGTSLTSNTFKADTTVIASKLFTVATYQTKLTNPITGSGTTGQAAFFTGSTTQSSDANFFWDNTNKRLGLGNNTPMSVLHTVETSTSTSRGINSDQYSTNTSGSRITMRKARGTFLSPTTVVTGDALGSWTASGYDGTNFIDAAKILVTSAGTIGTNTVPATMALQTASSTGSLTTGLSIDQNQNVSITNSVTAGAIIKSGGTSSQFLKADGSVDASTYAKRTDILPPRISGQFSILGYACTGITSATGFNGVIYSTILQTSKTGTLTAIQVRISNAVNSKNIRISIYSDLGNSTFQPNAPLDGTGSGDIDCTTTGWKIYTLSTPLALTDPFYHICIQSQDAGIGFNYISAGGSPIPFSLTGGLATFGSKATQSYGSFPNPFPSPTYINGGSAYFEVKINY